MDRCENTSEWQGGGGYYNYNENREDYRQLYSELYSKDFSQPEVKIPINQN